MLRITPEAGLAINRMVTTDGGGLRLTARVDEANFDLTVVARPDDVDVVVTDETTGARVVLDPTTADYVDDKTLDVSDTIEGTARFQLKGQDVTRAD